MLRPCNTKGKVVEINCRVFPKNLYIFAGFAYKTGNALTCAPFTPFPMKARRCLMAPRAFNISKALCFSYHIVLFEKSKEKNIYRRMHDIVKVNDREYNDTCEKFITFYRNKDIDIAYSIYNI